MDPNLEKYSRHKSMYIGTVGPKYILCGYIDP